MRGWRGPTYPEEFPTLGYEVIRWLFHNIPSPSDDSKAFVPTPEQYQLILRWYRIDPTSGRFVYRRGAIEMAKGWGKSPLVGAIALAEFASRAVLFAGWDSNGEPLTRGWGEGDDPPPYVQIAANSEDQSENTYGAIYSFLSAKGGKVGDALGIDVGRKVGLYRKDMPGALLEPVTASAGSREGARITFAVLDETHLWTKRSRGAQLANTLRRNVAKMNGRTLETTNAPILGEQSVAEMTGKAAEANEPGVWFHTRRPSIEPQPDWPDEDMLRELERVYGDSWWVDRPRILREIRDPATDWVDALRFYFNTRTVGAGRAVDPQRWDQLARPKPDMGTVIGLGFDGSYTRDATVLIGCDTEGTSFVLGWWENPGDRDWTVPRDDVDRAVADAFERYRVGLMLADPPYWYTEIAGWADKYRIKRVKGTPIEDVERVVPFDTSQPRRMAPAVNRWMTAIAEGAHTHDGDARLASHVKAAHLRKVNINAPEDDGRTKYVLEKGEDRQRIDGAVADVLAYEAAMTLDPPKPTPRVEMILL